jgi:DNA-binding NarL/FixJ family response regulator
MKILIVDDHELLRQGLKSWLDQQSEPIESFEASDLDSAIAVVRNQPDVDLVLFDLGLPGVSGLEALKAFRAAHGSVPVVVLSGTSDQQTVLDAIDCGAMGFIPKTASIKVLKEALQVVLSNRIFLPSVFMHTVPPRTAAPLHLHEKFPHLQLTCRQRQVFKLVLQGKPNKEIALALGVAESTIKSHIRPILQALQVTSRVGAIVEISRLGLSLD